MQPFLETWAKLLFSEVFISVILLPHIIITISPLDGNCPGLWIDYTHWTLKLDLVFSPGLQSVRAPVLDPHLSCSLQPPSACPDPEISSPGGQHCQLHLTTVSTWSYVSIKPAHQISQMSHCFKGLWIILNERVRGQKCNILNILIYIQKNIAACRHYHIFRVTSAAFRVTVVTLWHYRGRSSSSSLSKH